MTGLTRRAVVRTAALGLAASPFLVGPDAFAAVTTRRGLYSRRRFTVLRGRGFAMESGGRRWRGRLVKVANLPHSRRRDPHAFSLTFTTSRPGPSSGTFVVRRRGFRPTSLFLVAGDAGCRTYEAVVVAAPRDA
jgi:hypothetical protein